ncbi:hypothetical protein JW758_00815 [Candidatus Peregrinibacteria bacterium]|nr:hypothetical protein [Candidatus Peregrinibacteria bacterium]
MDTAVFRKNRIRNSQLPFPIQRRTERLFKKGAYLSAERLYILPSSCLQQNFGLESPEKGNEKTILICGFEDETDPEINLIPKTIADGTFPEVIAESDGSYFMAIVRNRGLVLESGLPDNDTREDLASDQGVVFMRLKKNSPIIHVVPLMKKGDC